MRLNIIMIKLIRCFKFTSILFFWAVLSEPSHAFEKHKFIIDKSINIDIISNKKNNAEIITGKSPCSTVRYAANELQKYIELSTGVTIPIVVKSAKNKVAIYIGDSPNAKTAGIDVNKLPRDAFIIKTNGNNEIYITGKDNMSGKVENSTGNGSYERATLNGVYEFLERFVGCRFYFPGEIGTIVPKHKNLSVNGIDLYEEPDYLVRNIYIGSTRLSDDIDKKKRSKFMIEFRLQQRKESKTIPCCHGLSRRKIAKRYGKSHPEYFSILANGNRDTDMSLPGLHGHMCYSNEGLRQNVYEESAAYFTGKSAKSIGMEYYSHCSFQPGYVDIGPQDGMGKAQWCHCPKCINYWKEGRQTDLIWDFVTNIAKRLKKNNIKGSVTCFAYGCYRKLPNVDFPDNVEVMLCITGPWADHIKELKDTNDRLIKQWNNKINCGEKVWLWNYMTNINARVPEGVSPLSMHAMDRYYKRIKNDIRGAFLEAEINYFLFNYLNYNTFYKLMWNIDTDIDAMLKEHNRLMFGAASKPMGEFFSTIEKMWNEKFLFEFRDTEMGPTMAKRSEREVWDEIFTDEVFAKFDSLYDEAEKLAANDIDAMKRVKFFREKYLGEMKNERAKYYNRKKEIEDLACYATLADKITIDGKLDVSEWKGAQSIGLMPFNNKVKNEKISAHTDIMVKWDEKNVYFAFKCAEPKMDKLFVDERERDNDHVWEDSSVEIFLNPTNDRKIYYQFMINANGNLADLKGVRNGNDSTIDWKWNGNIEVKTSKSTVGWIVEARIAISSFGIEALQNNSSWIVNFCRTRNIRDAKKNENQLQSWSTFLKLGFHDLDRFGRIIFVKEIPANDNIIRNSSFEDAGINKSNPWRIDKNHISYVSFSDETFREGHTSLKIEVPEGKEENFGPTQYLPELKPDSKYLLTYYAKGDNIKQTANRHSGAYINLWCDLGFNNLYPSNLIKGTFGWTKFGFKFKTPKMTNTPKAYKGRKAYIRVRMTNASGTLWVDDIRIRKLSKSE